MRTCIYLLHVGLLSSGLGSTSQAESEYTAKEVLMRAIEAREAIQAGTIQWTLTHPKTEPYRSSYERVLRHYDISFTKSPSKFKALIDWDTGKSSWEQQTLKNPTNGTFLDRGRWSPHADMSSDDANERLQSEVFNPRLLGFAPQRLSMFPGDSVREYVTGLYLGAVDEEIRRGTLRDVQVLIVSGRLNEKSTYAISVAPSLNYNPLEIRIERRAKTYVLENEYQAWNSESSDAGKVWYPRKVTFSEYKSGTLQSQDELVVTSASFVKDLPDAEFALASLDMRPGRRIMGDRGRAYVAPSGSETIRPATSEDVLDHRTGDYITPEGIESRSSTAPYWRDRLLWLNIAIVVGLSLAVILLRLRGS